MRLQSMMAGTPAARRRLVLVALVMFLFLFVQAASTTNVRAQRKSKKAKDGFLAIHTNKRNLKISINGKTVARQRVRRKDDDGIMRFIVPAGKNTIEVLLPESNDRWKKEIDVPAGSMGCLNLTHRYGIINRGDSKTDPPRALGADVKLVEYITDSYQLCGDEESMNDVGLSIHVNLVGCPILVDGQLRGATIAEGNSIPVTPGEHKIEIDFPNRRWSKEVTATRFTFDSIELEYNSKPSTDPDGGSWECTEIIDRSTRIAAMPDVTRERKKKTFKKP